WRGTRGDPPPNPGRPRRGSGPALRAELPSAPLEHLQPGVGVRGGSYDARAPLKGLSRQRSPASCRSVFSSHSSAFAAALQVPHVSFAHLASRAWKPRTRSLREPVPRSFGELRGALAAHHSSRAG